ncbi:MAG: hypothetical protein ACRDU9_07285 [Acidimicrobiia bacterium]
MARESMVIEDGVDGSRSVSKPKSGWILAAVGFAFGLGVGVVVTYPAAVPTPVGAVVEPAIDEEVTPPEDLSNIGISGSVPGFPDALVGVGDAVGSGLDHLLWPLRGPLVVRTMTGGSDVRFDATGQFLAMSEQVPALDGLLLSMGRFNGIRPVISGVTSFAWHDSESAELSFTTETDGEWKLFRVSANFTPKSITTEAINGGSVAAWGDWGYAIQTEDEMVVLLTSDGRLKDVEPGVALASHHTGWVLVDDDGLKLLSAGGGVRGLGAPAVPVRRVLTATFAPDGQKVALGGTAGVAVLDTTGVSDVSMVSNQSSPWVAWSSDSRFVIAPAPSGVLIHDLDSGETSRVLIGHTVVAADVLPVSAS